MQAGIFNKITEITRELFRLPRVSQAADVLDQYNPYRDLVLTSKRVHMEMCHICSTSGVSEKWTSDCLDGWICSVRYLTGPSKLAVLENGLRKYLD